ncbi:Trank1 [Symbiodinium sp. KB8]|nr:Trank1 [Symbiodinium sp. KB8]
MPALREQKVLTCSMCSSAKGDALSDLLSMREVRKGGFEFLCGGKYHVWVTCGDENGSCNSASDSRILVIGFSITIDRFLKGGADKLPCPTYKPNSGGSSCGLSMTRSIIAPLPEEDPVPTGTPVRPPPAIWTEVPDINHLTHNHRSTHGILELASAILDIITGLFPDKIDKLPREKSRVKSSAWDCFWRLGLGVEGAGVWGSKSTNIMV